MKCLRRLRPQYAQQGSGFFVYDNAHLHTANIVKQFLAKKRGRVQIEYAPSFSQDLNLPDFFVFLGLKRTSKGKRFNGISNIQRKVTRLLNTIPKEDFLKSFQDTCIRSQGCIVMGCDYFKSQ
ncbi:hypothetical protein TNCV_142331 [Trichonephila clavipes]|nr:hypothetical protein TNCV_142331 [Trichonephila clavipes]